MLFVVISWFIKQVRNYFNNNTPKHKYQLYKLILKKLSSRLEIPLASLH